MENKKLGILLIVISIIVGSMFFYYNSQLSKQANEIKCFPTEECLQIEESLTFTHFSIGIFSFILSLGFYLIFFNKTDEKIFSRLEKEKEEKIEDIKFDILMKALDSYEQKVIKAVKNQPGITQSTLRIKTDMSKAKLSYVLQELQKRNLIKRIEKGKTFEIHLKI